MALDPIEKKPLYHFYPGSTILSVGTWGCNFHCQFCQNWAIAHGNPQVFFTEAEQLAQLAMQQGPDCIGVAYTYSEPTVWFEYVKDSAAAVKKAGLKNVLVTNGFINEEPLKALLPVIDAMNIDVKSFHPEFYQERCKGGLAAVKRTVEIASRHCHVEVTTLLIPGLNDSDEEITHLIHWLATINPEIPLHFSRYYPSYRMNRQPTPLETLMRARELALPFIHHVHIGNV
jgi:pyruvate formate lyase activating enzyme